MQVENKKAKPLISAVCGKGGVGKTTISALLIKLLTKDSNKKVLGIDADPAEGLSTALGLPVNYTLNDIREEIIQSLQNDDKIQKEELLYSADYKLFNSMVEQDNLAFISIGRPENQGCYCAINSFLKENLSKLAAHFDYVVIDGEAGIEQINRRVMDTITHLILISDTSVKGLKVANTLKQLSLQLLASINVGLIINRVPMELSIDRTILDPDIKILGYLPEEAKIQEYDANGYSFLELPDNLVMQGIESIVHQFLISKSAS